MTTKGNDTIMVGHIGTLKIASNDESAFETLPISLTIASNHDLTYIANATWLQQQREKVRLERCAA